MNEELTLIVELFSKVTNGALVGGITWMVVDLIKDIIPWCIGSITLIKLSNNLPRIVISRKDKE